MVRRESRGVLWDRERGRGNREKRERVGRVSEKRCSFFFVVTCS